MVEVFPAPRGIGPYGITATPDGEIYYGSLAGSHLGEVDRSSGEVRVHRSANRWCGAAAGLVGLPGSPLGERVERRPGGVYDPATDSWQEWQLPGDAPQAYAVYVDEADVVWLTDFTRQRDRPLRPDRPRRFVSFPSGEPAAEVRQILGRPGRGVGRRVGCRSAGGDPDVTLNAGR